MRLKGHIISQAHSNSYATFGYQDTLHIKVVGGPTNRHGVHRLFGEVCVSLHSPAERREIDVGGPDWGFGINDDLIIEIRKAREDEKFGRLAPVGPGTSRQDVQASYTVS